MTLPGAPLLPQITDWLGPPAWSPDGARLLLRTRAGDVVVVSIAGSSQVVAHEGLTEWSWLSDTVVATVARADPDRILVQVDIATRKRTETVLAREATTGAFSGSARFLAFTPPSSGGAETYLIDLRVPHVARRAGAGVVRGWTADEQLVVHAAGSPGSLRSVDPVTLEQRVLLADARDGIASPRASAAVGIDGSGALWVIRPGESAVRQPGPSVAGTLAALSANAVAIGLVDRRPQPTGNDRIRAVVRIVATGEDLSACDNGCGDVALR